MRIRLALPFVAIVVLLAAVLVLTSCGNPVRPAPPRPTPTATSAVVLDVADRDQGKQLFAEAQCVACHGPEAAGGIGPVLANTTMSYHQFLTKVRTALPPKPAYSAEELSDQAVNDIYGWLQAMSTSGEAAARPPFAMVKVEPGQETLPEGEILGMSLWTGFKCAECHGAFAQGTSRGSALAGISYPYELERAKMRQTADEIPEHAQEFMRDTVLKRLYQWLQEGADPDGGC